MEISHVDVWINSRFMFHVGNGFDQEIFKTYCRFNWEIHTHLRSLCEYLDVSVVDSDLRKSNIRFRSVIIWSKIPSEGVNSAVAEAVFVLIVERRDVNDMLKV